MQGLGFKCLQKEPKERFKTELDKMTIIYKSEKKPLKVNNEDNLLKLCLSHKIPLSHSCGGMASCGTCRVIITDGLSSLAQRNNLEQKMANDRTFKDHERLACQLKLNSSFQFVLPGEEKP